MNQVGINPAPDPLLELRDIHLPPAPGWWPPAPGWWLLGTITLLLLCGVLVQLRKRFNLRRQRRRLLAELSALEEGYTAERTPAFLAAVSILLRRVAIARFPRREVAALHGIEWLKFLDATGGEGQFLNGAGRALGAGPYQPSAETEPGAIVALAGEWIRRNVGQSGWRSEIALTNRARSHRNDSR